VTINLTKKCRLIYQNDNKNMQQLSSIKEQNVTEIAVFYRNGQHVMDSFKLILLYVNYADTADVSRWLASATTTAAD